MATQGADHRSRSSPGWLVSAPYQRIGPEVFEHGGVGSLQGPAGCRGGFLRTQKLLGSATGVSLAARPSGQPCAIVLLGLLAERAAGTRVADQGRNRGSSTSATSLANHPAWNAQDGPEGPSDCHDTDSQDLERADPEIGFGAALCDAASPVRV